MYSNILKIGFFAACFMLLTATVQAQTNQPDYVEFNNEDYPGEKVDTVTVGSRMPYFVAPQDEVYGMTFEYKWVFGPTSLPILNFAGDVVTAGSSEGFYAENEISVEMPSEPGELTVSTNVQSVVGGTVLCAPGEDVTYNIQVVPAPTLEWDGNSPLLLCVSNLSSEIPVGIQLTGYRQWMLDYKIVKYNLDGSDLEDFTPIAIEDVVIGENTNINKTSTFAIDGSNFLPGKYSVTITKLTDRISRKSLDFVDGNYPESSFDIMVYPAPTTKPLQHIRNMPQQ
jgi:hypothetical protein